MSTPSSPDTAARPPRLLGPPNLNETQTSQPQQLQHPRPPHPTPTSGVQTQVRPEYVVLLTPNPRQPGVQGLRYPYIPIQRHQLQRHQFITGPSATILQRPALIRGVTQQGMSVHPAVIPTSQPFGIAGMPASIAAPGSPMLHHQQYMIGSAPASTAPSRMNPPEVLSKGTNFFNSILTKVETEMNPQKAENIKVLIQALIDGKKTSEEFASALQIEFNSSPQVQLVPFLDLLLPHLRHSMISGQTTISGIRPPIAPVQTPIQTTPSDQTYPPVPSTSSLPRQAQNTAQVATTIPAIATSMPAPSAPGPPPAKKKKVPLPPGQKSAYAIKKEAREARKREKELAAQNLQAEKTDDKPDSEQKVEKPPAKPKPDKPKRQDKQKKSEKQLESLSAALRDDDDVNDVAAMGGVNLAEENQKIMASGAELVGTQIRSCKDEAFFDIKALSSKITRIVKEHNLPGPSNDVITIISHATQERLKDLVERLGVLADHRIENLRSNPKYEITNDIKGQMKFLAELDRIEKRRYEEQERELLLRVAKSRSKVEDPEQLKLRQKAKDMQRAEQEEVRQREANQTALLAIGPRKKLKTSSGPSSIASSQVFSQTSSFSDARIGDTRADSVRRTKRVNMRDLQVLLELDRMYLDRLVKIATQ